MEFYGRKGSVLLRRMITEDYIETALIYGSRNVEQGH